MEYVFGLQAHLSLRIMQYLVNVIQIHILGIEKTVTETKKEIL